MNVTDLRKAFTAQGIKGFSSANRATFTAAIEAAELAAYAEDTERTPAPAAKKNGCEDCGRRVVKSIHPSLCELCLDYAGWENTHNDDAHGEPNREASESETDCPVCHPELDRRSAKPGRSRAGMVIIAKGTEIHKSETFRKAAEAAGWTVKVQSETYELPEDAEGEGTRFYATATKGGSSISLAWDGRAYDYPNSSAVLNGKDRKIRNLKEALRVL